jgi:hypothetical protein
LFSEFADSRGTRVRLPETRKRKRSCNDNILRFLRRTQTFIPSSGRRP